MPQMKHGLNTDQDRSQEIEKEPGDEDVEAADGKAGQKTFATDETRSRPEARIRFAPSFHHLNLFFFVLFAVLIRVQSVFHPWLEIVPPRNTERAL